MSRQSPGCVHATRPHHRWSGAVLLALGAAAGFLGCGILDAANGVIQCESNDGWGPCSVGRGCNTTVDCAPPETLCDSVGDTCAYPEDITQRACGFAETALDNAPAESFLIFDGEFSDVQSEDPDAGLCRFFYFYGYGDQFVAAQAALSDVDAIEIVINDAADRGVVRDLEIEEIDDDFAEVYVEGVVCRGVGTAFGDVLGVQVGTEEVGFSNVLCLPFES